MHSSKAFGRFLNFLILMILAVVLLGDRFPEYGSLAVWTSCGIGLLSVGCAYWFGHFDFLAEESKARKSVDGLDCQEREVVEDGSESISDDAEIFRELSSGLSARLRDLEFPVTEPFDTGGMNWYFGSLSGSQVRKDDQNNIFIGNVVINSTNSKVVMNPRSSDKIGQKLKREPRIRTFEVVED